MLKKALCGLKQALYLWDTRIDDYFMKDECKKCPYKHVLYLKKEVGGSVLYACI